MITIKRNFETLEIEIELQGVPSIPYERFYISMELITGNAELNEAYMAFRNLARYGTPDYLRMPIIRENQAAMNNLRRLSFCFACLPARVHESTHITERIVKTSVLA